MLQLTKDPDAVLDYKFDLGTAANKTPWLAADETITSATIAVTIVTLNSFSITDAGKSVTVWVSSGTVGETMAEIRCRYTTSAGRTDDRTIQLAIAQR
jgi:hypothetical protein